MGSGPAFSFFQFLGLESQEQMDLTFRRTNYCEQHLQSCVTGEAFCSPPCSCPVTAYKRSSKSVSLGNEA